MRRILQHYMNGLRVKAWLVRHGMEKGKAGRLVKHYEAWSVYAMVYER